MTLPESDADQAKRRVFRQSLAYIFRRLPTWIRGRLRVGSGIDKFLGWTGYSHWQENIDCADGVRMFLDTNESQQKQIYWIGSYDRLAVDALVRSLPDHGVLVDVGAGVGSICLFVVKACAMLGKSVSVQAFEPLGINYERLLQNTSLNLLTGHVSCHRVALGAERGTVNLCFSEGVGAAAVVQSGTEISTLAGPQLECVPTETLDDWVTENRLTRFDVLKVDIEGAEPLMFRGAIRTIEKFLPVILGEFNHWWAERHDLSITDNCFAPLWDMGYRAFRLDSHGGPWKAVLGRPAPGPNMEDTLWIPPGRSILV